MEKESDAQAAMAGLQGSLLDGSKINVELSRGKRTDGFGPFRRRGGRFRGGPPDRMHGPPRYMEPYPSMQPNRFGPRWDDNYGRPYGIPSRGSPRG